MNFVFIYQKAIHCVCVVDWGDGVFASRRVIILLSMPAVKNLPTCLHTHIILCVTRGLHR